MSKDEEATTQDLPDEPAVSTPEDVDPPHVAQAKAELENAVRLGQDDAVGAARKRLAAAGVDPNEAEKAARAAHKREAAKERKAAAEDSDDPEAAKKSPPQGRTAAPKETTTPRGAEPAKPSKATPAAKSKT